MFVQRFLLFSSSPLAVGLSDLSEKFSPPSIYLNGWWREAIRIFSAYSQNGFSKFGITFTSPSMAMNLTIWNSNFTAFHIMASSVSEWRGYCRLIIMLRLGWSGSVVWSLGDEALKSFQSYFWSRPCPLLAFAYTWMLSQLAKVWPALVTKASRLNFILASLWELSPFQSFFFRFNWNCQSPSKLWFERWKSLNAFAWRDLRRKFRPEIFQGEYSKDISSIKFTEEIFQAEYTKDISRRKFTEEIFQGEYPRILKNLKNIQNIQEYQKI